ncbi:hypothetical protein EMIT0P253_140054 [Pseudomonas sp. IT-P253]
MRWRPDSRPDLAAVPNFPYGSWLACEGGLPADLILRLHPIPCGSEPAREGGLTADLILRLYPTPCVRPVAAGEACVRRRSRRKPVHEVFLMRRVD